MQLSDLLRGLRSGGVDLAAEHMLDCFWLAHHVSGKLFDDVEDVQQRTPAVQTQPALGGAAVIERTSEAAAGPRSAAPAQVWADAPSGVGTRRASLGSVPSARALPNRLDFSRALRPFTLRRKSAERSEMDEEQTVDASATIGFPFPILKPSEQRWFTVDLVLEDDPAIPIWRQTLREFFKILHESGAFDDVRFWHLEKRSRATDAEGSDFVLVSQAGARISTKFVAGSGVARLVLLATHGSSLNWTNGSYDRLLRDWLDTSSVALIYLLPEGDRKRSPLGEPQGLCSAVKPGLPVAQLDVRRYWWTISDETTSPFVPVLGLDPASVHRFAKMQMGLGGSNPVIFLDSSRITSLLPNRANRSESDFEQIISALAVQSPDALRLARLLCTTPFTLPVARLIQEAVLGRDTSPYVLAQVMLSGIVGTAEAAANSDPERTYFEVRALARRILLRSLRKSEAEAAASELEARVSMHLENIQDRVGRYAVRYLDERGEHSIPDFASAFARVSRALLGDPATAADLKAKAHQFRNRFSERRLADVLDKLRYGRHLPLDPESTEDDVWKGLLENGLVRQNSSGEWRLRVGVWEEIAGEPLADDEGEQAPTAPLKTVSQFALVIGAPGVPGMPLIADVQADAQSFVGWLGEIGIAREQVLYLEQPDRIQLLDAVESLAKHAKGAGDHRRVFIYFAGHTVVDGQQQLFLRMGSSEPEDIALSEIVSQSANHGSFDDIVCIIDGEGAPLLGSETIMPLSLVQRIPHPVLPNILTIVAQGFGRRAIAPRSFTAEILDALRTATVNGYVTTRSLTQRLHKRLSSEVSIRLSGNDFTICGPLAAMIPTQGPIRSTWIVTSIGEVKELLAREFRRTGSSRDELDSFELKGPDGGMSLSLFPSKFRMPRADPPQAIIVVGTAYRANESDRSRLLVATEFAREERETLAPSMRLLNAAHRVSYGDDWSRYISIPNPGAPHVAFGTLADMRMERGRSALSAAGFSSGMDEIAELQEEFPQAHLLAVYVLSDAPRQDLTVNRQLASLFVRALVQSLLERPEQEQSRSSVALDVRQQLERRLTAALAALPQSPAESERELGQVAKLLSRDGKRDIPWMHLEARLAAAYVEVSSRINQAKNLSAAIKHYRRLRDYYSKVERDSLEVGRMESHLGDTLSLRGELTQSLTDLEAAEACFRRAADHFRAANRTNEAASLQHRIQVLADRRRVQSAFQDTPVTKKTRPGSPRAKKPPSESKSAKSAARARKPKRKVAKKKK
ncbi:MULTISPECIES: SAV_2336 N-terminal domain-related protein [Bradyrhizobium]|uniref:SAV_2336 N-terminal domain-related protein n=1 Tax=Bradyrhizobium TaxID=374 RepID=UPI00041C1F25|nr:MULTISPECIES: SAV_2336 N-terminal domain-related protein [Bradyrhizobium]UFW51481.1 hypothetical protein BaraCB756_11115 [Bradyrhizobium arachidis]